MWGLIPTFGKEGRKQPLISEEDLTIARLSEVKSEGTEGMRRALE